MKFRYEIAFPADSVWEIVGDFTCVEWLGNIEGQPLTLEQETGIIRTFELEHFNSPSLHRLDSRNNRHRCLTFTVIDTPLSILLNARVAMHVAVTPADTSALYVSLMLPNMQECYRDDIYCTVAEWGAACTRRIQYMLSERPRETKAGAS